MSIVDLGCDSGRLAHALGNAFEIDYLGIDIESYLYLEDARRVLKADGKLVFSSSASSKSPNLPIGLLSKERSIVAWLGATAPLNMMLERPMIMRMAERLGYSKPIFIGAIDAPGEVNHLASR